MGNENEVEKQNSLEKTKKLNYFLPSVSSSEIEAEKYNLEEEYSKTKKNKSFFVYFIVFFFLLFIVGVTFLISNYMNKNTQNSDLGITEFENINLQDLLDDSKNKANRLKNLQLELERIKNNYSTDISTVKIKYSKLRENLLNQNLSFQERKIQLDKLKQSEKDEIAKIQNEKKKKIKSKEKEIRVLKEEIRVQNLKMQRGMSKADAIVNNYKKLNELKLAKQKADYEKKIYDLTMMYNPYFRNRKIQQILQLKYSKQNINNLISLKNALARERGISRQETKEIEKLIDSYNILSQRFDKIPYKNSVPKGLETLSKINSVVISKLDKYSNRLNQIIRNQNSLLYKYEKAFQYLAKSTAEGGYIINADNFNSILIYINPIIEVKPKQIGMIFRQDDDYIGKIQIINTGKYKTAKVVELSQGKKIQPFDKIIMKVQ